MNAFVSLRREREMHSECALMVALSATQSELTWFQFIGELL